MNKRIVQFIVTLAMSILLIGCEDAKYGEKFKSFATNEAPKISRDYAQATLNQRWEQVFVDYMTIGLSELDFIHSVIKELEDYGELDYTNMSEKELLNAFVDLIEQENTTTQLFRRMDSLKKSQSEILSSCKSRKTFYSLGINSMILKDAFAMANMDIEVPIKYGLDSGLGAEGNIIQVGIDFVTNIFSKDEMEEQKKLFSEGKAALDQRIIKDDELFSLSSDLCLNFKNLYSASLQEIKVSIEKLDKLVRSKYSYVQTQKSIVGSHLVPLKVDRILRETGLDETLSYYNHIRAFGQISETMTEASQMIYEAQRTMANTPQNLKSYLAFENYQIQLENLETELNILKDSEKWSEQTIMHRRIKLLITLIARERARIRSLM